MSGPDELPPSLAMLRNRGRVAGRSGEQRALGDILGQVPVARLVAAVSGSGGLSSSSVPAS
jgi:hypothetical protein